MEQAKIIDTFETYELPGVYEPGCRVYMFVCWVCVPGGCVYAYVY